MEGCKDDWGQDISYKELGLEETEEISSMYTNVREGVKKVRPVLSCC